MKIFVDTSGLYAALVVNDCNHHQAGETLHHLVSQGAQLHTCSYVLLETFALLQARIGLAAARQMELAVRPALKVRWVDEALHRRAFQRLELRGSRGLSLVDCAGFVVMEDEEIRLAFTFDRHFEQEGFRLVRSPRDLL